MFQVLITCHTFFFSFRTLEYTSWKDGNNLDWDLVPIMLMFIIGYAPFQVIAYLIFDSGREINTKVYNESLKLRGENNNNIYLAFYLNTFQKFCNKFTEIL